MKNLTLLSLLASLMILVQCGSDDAPTLDDDDETPIVIDPISLDFGEQDLTIDESSDDQSITISFGDLAAPISGTFNIALGGTATYGEDYSTVPAATDGNIEISVAEGDESKSFSVSFEDDSELELDETITLEITSDVEELELGSNTSITITLTSNDQALVAIERSTGQMYMVDLADGTQTDLISITGITSESEPARVEEGNQNIRSFVYDPASEKGFVGQNSQGGSKIYSVDMSTGAATVLFTNDNENFYLDGVLDFHLDGGVLYGASYYGENSGGPARIDIEAPEPSSGHAYYQIDKSTGAISNETILIEYEFAGGGALYVEDDLIYYPYRWYYEEGEGEEGMEGSALLSLDLSDDSKMGTFWTTDDNADFAEDFEGFDISDVAVQTFAIGTNNEVYAVITPNGDINYEDYRVANGINVVEPEPSYAWFLVSVDLDDAKISYVSTLTTEKSTQVQAIGFLPEEVVVPLLTE